MSVIIQKTNYKEIESPGESTYNLKPGKFNHVDDEDNSIAQPTKKKALQLIPFSQPSSTTTSPRSKFAEVVVVEVYSTFENEDLKSQTVRNEIIGNSDSGIILAKKFHPAIRYIWSLNNKVSIAVAKRAQKYTHIFPTTVNLASANDEERPCLGKKSRLIIVGQGHPELNAIAELDVEAFIEFLSDDLNVKKLSELELIVCGIGRDLEYLHSINSYFQNKTKITSYTELVGVDLRGNPVTFPMDDGEEELSSSL